MLPPVDRAFAGRRHTVSSLGTGLPVCHLTIEGRVTGAQRTVTLLYGRDGDMLVVAESNWGQCERPSWALNLDASRQATVVVGGVSRPVSARRATPDEAARW